MADFRMVYVGTGDDQWAAPDPDSETLELAEWGARHEHTALTREQLLVLGAVADAWTSLLSAELTDRESVAKWRALRAEIGRQRAAQRSADIAEVRRVNDLCRRSM